MTTRLPGMHCKKSLLYAVCIVTLCGFALTNYYNLLSKNSIKLKQLSILSEQRKFIMRRNSTLSPIRSLVITTWRSGSTFLGDILNSMDGNYYHYEPFLHKGIVQIRDNQSEVATEATQHIAKLLRCDYSDMEAYMQHARKSELFHRNTRLWRHCHPFCYDPMFVQWFCAQCPIQSMKVVRLRLSLFESILTDISLNIRLVYLIRDPRAIMESRKDRPWCKDSLDCNDPTSVCNDLRQDYETAQRFVELYPNKFRVLHFENLALNPYNVTKEILQFYGRNYTPEVNHFLNEHTRTTFSKKGNTYRHSADIPFQWMNKMKSREIFMIQKKCLTALQLWKYKIIEHGQKIDNKFKKDFYQFDD